MASPRLNREDFQVGIPVRVRFRDLDPFLHLNNGVYLSLFEEARTAYMAHLPDLKEVIQEQGALTAIMEHFPTTLVRAEVEVRGQAYLHEVLEVCVRIEKIRRSFIHMEYGVFRKEGSEKIARGSTELIHIDRESFRPRGVPPSVIENLERFENRNLTGEAKAK